MVLPLTCLQKPVWDFIHVLLACLPHQGGIHSLSGHWHGTKLSQTRQGLFFFCLYSCYAEGSLCVTVQYFQ